MIRAGVAMALLALGVAAVLACSLGLLAVRNAYDRLHVPGAATILGCLAIGLSLMVAPGVDSGVRIRIALAGFAMVMTGPVLGHAIARAERLRRHGSFRAWPGDEEARP